MDNAGVNISSVFTSQTAICFLLNANDLKKASRAIKSGAPLLISEVETISDIALVALVGEGITKKRGIAAKAFQAVAAENINIEIIAAGASTAAVYFVVLESDCDRAVKATHTYFFPECPGAGSHQHSDLTSFVL
jgi:bifunctional aspartokinase / homoserine dehydrogenase 1